MTSAMAGRFRFSNDGWLVGASIVVAAAAAWAMAAAPGWVGVGSALWVCSCVLFWYSPATGIASVAFSIPFQEQIRIPSFLDDSTFTRFVIVALMVAFLIHMLGGLRIHVDGIALTHALIIVTLIATYGQAVHLERWLGEVYRWSLPLVVYLMCRSLPLGMRDRVFIAAAAGGGVICSAVIAFRQAVVSAGPESYEVGGMTRVFGMFGHPNTLAAFLGLSVPLMLAIALSGTFHLGGTIGIAIPIAAAMGCAVLVMTQSRGGWLASGCAIGFVLLFSHRSAQRWTVFICAAAALGLMAVSGPGIVPGLARFGSMSSVLDPYIQVTTERWGQLEREAHWGAASAMLREYPWLGVGAGQFNEHFRNFTTQWRFRIPRGQAHNGYLHMASQAGYPGLAMYLLWIGTILFALHRAALGAIGARRVLAIGATGCMVAYLVHSIFEYLGGLSLPILLAVVIAIALPSAQHDRYGPGESELPLATGGCE